MNVFFAIILAALIVDFGLGQAANLLNLRALKPEVPVGAEGVYEPDEYRRSQDYTRATTRFRFVTGIFQLLLLLGFWFAGGFNYLDQVVRSWGFVSIANGLFFTGILLLGQLLLTLPFNIYATFSIEERFGFNKTTRSTFVADRLKGLALLLLLGAPLLAGIIAFFEYTGDLAWLYCWVAVSLFSLALQFVAPTWIMPLFNKFSPMEPGELKEAILSYARSVDFGIDNVFVMDGSKRSSKANAFFTGFGRHKRIALFDTLIEKHTVPELVAVLAHEIGHYKKRHIQQRTVIGILDTGVISFLLSVFLESGSLYDAFFMEEESIYAGFLFFALLYTPVEVPLSVVMQMLSRKHEYEGDRFAAETVDEPQSLIDGLKKLAADNLENLAPHPLYTALNHSHPPLLQRVQAIGRLREAIRGSG